MEFKDEIIKRILKQDFSILNADLGKLNLMYEKLSIQSENASNKDEYKRIEFEMDKIAVCIFFKSKKITGKHLTLFIQDQSEYLKSKNQLFIDWFMDNKDEFYKHFSNHTTKSGYGTIYTKALSKISDNIEDMKETISYLNRHEFYKKKYFVKLLNIALDKYQLECNTFEI